MILNNELKKEQQIDTLDRKISVLLVEDHLVLREGLIKLLEGADDVVVTETAGTAEEALEKIHDDLDLILLDISLPGKDGIWLAGKVKAGRPQLPILVLTMHEQPGFVLKALESGVDGYLTKWTGRTELLKAIRLLVGDGSYLQTRIAPLVVEALRRRERGREVSFSEREHEIARYLVNGLSNSEIAGKIRLSVSTVKSDLRSLYSKLDVSCRTEAVARVVEKGLVCQD